MIDTVRRRRRRPLHPPAARFFRWSLRVWNILLEPAQCTVRHWLLLDNSFLYCCGPLAVTLYSFSKRFKLDWPVRAELPLSPLEKKQTNKKNQPVVSTLNSGAAATVCLNVRRGNETRFGSEQTRSRSALSVLPRLGFVWQWVWRKGNSSSRLSGKIYTCSWFYSL